MLQLVERSVEVVGSGWEHCLQLIALDNWMSGRIFIGSHEYPGHLFDLLRISKCTTGLHGVGEFR